MLELQAYFTIQHVQRIRSRAEDGDEAAQAELQALEREYRERQEARGAAAPPVLEGREEEEEGE